ncbi:MAG TPA: alanine racemase, partial [Acidimicrobiales bacterium]|nr:alanine racemase [Acidimicrobiales bacterium]
MIAPRLEVDLVKVEHNARELVTRLSAKGINVTGVTKAVLGDPSVAAALQRGGVVGVGDSRVENLTRMRSVGRTAPTTLIRTPMPSQVD